MEEIVKAIFAENNINNRKITHEKNMNDSFFNEDKSMMVKFYDNFEKATMEKAVHNFFSKEGDVPVPEIIRFGEKAGKNFVLRRCVEGIDLDQHFDQYGYDDELVYEAGRILALIHKTHYDKKGVITPQFTVKEYPIFSNDELKGFIAVLKPLLPEGVVQRLNEIHADDYFDVDHYSLCHGDYAMKNMIVKDGEIKAILDFEWISSAPPMDDIASFEFFLELRGFEDGISSFRRGYRSVNPLPMKYEPNRDFYISYKGLTMLATHFSQVEGVFGVGEEKLILSQTLKYLKKV